MPAVNEVVVFEDPPRIFSLFYVKPPLYLYTLMRRSWRLIWVTKWERRTPDGGS